METLKSGDVPALVTNVEVMEILAARVEARRVREEENTTEPGTSGYGRKRLRRKPEHRHRDWIELKVLNDLKNSPCGVGGIDKTRELVGRIRGRAVAPAPGGGDMQSANQDGDGSGYGLTDGETLQILNHMPTEMVELHAMIDDLPGRMTESRQEELLDLIGLYVGHVDGDPCEDGDE